jgi:hypothetical protein
MRDACGYVLTYIYIQIVEVIDRYDAECVSANDKVGFIQDTKTDKACTRKITVSIYTMHRRLASSSFVLLRSISVSLCSVA